jgi:hypothetical protein
MKVIGWMFKLIGAVLKTGISLVICASILFVAYQGNQPMQVPEAPAGMTFFEFMGDKIETAKTVKPARCGWGMILSLAVLGPIYSVVYTEAGIHPDGVIAKGIAPDPDIPKDVAGAEWVEVPGVWWNRVENLSWTMLGKPTRFVCH